MRNLTSPCRFILLFACLLLFVTPTRAQDDSEWPARPKNQGWLTVHIDPYGAAYVALELPVKVQDQEQLKRSLAESFSFPVQVSDGNDQLEDEATEDGDSRGPWTSISAKSPKAFSGGLRSTCRLNLQPLLTQLRSYQLEHLKLFVIFKNANRDLEIEGAQKQPIARGIYLDHYEAYIDLRATATHVANFSMGYSAGDVGNRALLLLVFLLLPSWWTSRSARRFPDRPEELWGRHLRFLNRLLNAIWIVWLPVYALSGMGDVISYAFGPDGRALAQAANIAFYFFPPLLATLLCHFASKKVYEQVPAIEWSPKDVVRHAIATTAFSLTPLFLIVLGINTLTRTPRQAGAFAVFGYIGWILLSQTVGRSLAPRLHELTTGELRDRIFELAQKAGVLLQQIYVLPEHRAQLANAFARSDNSVGITNSLLRNLSRREVDAIMAHEIGHLQAKHPQRIGKITWGIIIGANVIGSVLASLIHLKHSTALVFAGALALASFTVSFVSRRNERKADAIGVGLTGDPEAFISGLAKLERLSLMPLHSGGWGESLDTHPGTMRRFVSIAKTHGITDHRMQELLAGADTPHDRYQSLEEEQAGASWAAGEFKSKYRVRMALGFLGVLLVAPIPFAMLLVKSGGSGLVMLGIAVAGIVWAFGIYQVARNRMSYWGYKSLSRQLRKKLGQRGLSELARYGTLVGLAPAAESRKYDGYPFWDAGVLWITNEKLYYIGELCEFAVERGQVTDIYTRDTNPEWLPEKCLFVQWAGESRMEVLHFVSIGESSVLKARRAVDSLQVRLHSWRERRENFPAVPPGLESIAAPAFPEITSTPAITKFVPSPVFAAALQFSVYAVVIGFALRLNLIGVFYMGCVAFVCTVLDELPKARTQPPPPVELSRGPSHQTGSWMDASNQSSRSA